MSSSQSAQPKAAAGRRSARPSNLRLIDLMARLTDRDYRILNVLADHSVLTTSQIAELAFSSRRHAQDRMATLTRYGAVSRFRTRVPVGSQQWRYALAPKGATIVAYRRDQSPPSTTKVRARIDALAASPRLGHILGVNGFFTSLTAAARRSRSENDGQYALVEWLSEYQCTQVYGRLARPDAYGHWRAGDREVAFFLEYDTGTEPLGRVTAKLTGYGDLALALDQPVLLLFWLPGPRRESNTRRELEPACPTGVYLATGTPALGSPADPVWLPLGESKRGRLTDLQTASQHQPVEDGRTKA